MRAEQLGRPLEKILGGHGEELGFVFCGIGIEERVNAAVDGIEQRLEFVGQVVGPRGDGALAVGEAEALGVEVVGELVQRDVVALAGMAGGFEHVLPRKDDAARLPRLAREHPAPLRDDASLVLDLVLHPERGRVHEHGMQVVIVAAPAEHEQAGKRCDRGADLVGDGEAMAADELLLGEKGAHQCFEPRTQPGREAADRGHVAIDCCDSPGRQRFGHCGRAAARPPPGCGDQPGQDAERDGDDRDDRRQTRVSRRFSSGARPA